MRPFIHNVNDVELSHPNNHDPIIPAIARLEHRGHYPRIKNSRQLRALLREGQCGFPGGYPVMAITADGGLLCNKCIKENLESVLWSIKHNCNDGWLVEAS